MTQRVLIVEDEEDIANLFTLVVRSEGYAVRSAGTLAEARKALASEPAPALVLLDSLLPDGDGLTLCPEIRQGFPQLPILVVSARPTRLVRAAAAAAGCPDVIPKPFDPDALLGRVRSLIGPP